MPTKPHTRSPGSICTAKANAGRFGYASGGLGTEAHCRSCFTPPEAASAHFAGCPKKSNVAVERPPPMIMRTDRPRPRAFSSRPLPPPALCECRHRGLACRLVAMRWPSVFVMAEGQRPHPRRTNRRGVDLKDAADNSAIDEHIEILVVPFTGRTGGRGTLEDQIVLVHFTEPTRVALLAFENAASIDAGQTVRIG